MQVLMTGGYGCIGSWVAKQLVEADQETSGSSTSRKIATGSTSCSTTFKPRPGPLPRRRRLRPRGCPPGGGDVRGHAPPAPGRVAGPDLPGRPDPGGAGQRPGDPRGLRGRRGLERTRSSGSSTPARPPCTVRHRPSTRPGRSATRSDSPRSRHYGAFKVCNELNARVYWLDRGVTSVGLRPWTVYGVGRDFGVTSEPTKAIKAVAAGRDYAISYGGLQDLQYVGDVASTFLHALDRPFEGAEAFNVRGAVVPIETFVDALKVASGVDRVTHGDRQLPIAPDLDDSRLEASLGPIPRTSLLEGVAETYRRFVELKVQGRLDLSEL